MMAKVCFKFDAKAEVQYAHTHILLHVVANKIIIIIIIIKNKQTKQKKIQSIQSFPMVNKKKWLCINIDQAVQQCSNLDVQSCRIHVV